jgi:hypothetical protein
MAPYLNLMLTDEEKIQIWRRIVTWFRIRTVSCVSFKENAAW